MIVKLPAGAYEGPNEDDLEPSYFEAKGKMYNKKKEGRLSAEYQKESKEITCNYNCDYNCENCYDKCK